MKRKTAYSLTNISQNVVAKLWRFVPQLCWMAVARARGRLWYSKKKIKKIKFKRQRKRELERERPWGWSNSQVPMPMDLPSGFRQKSKSTIVPTSCTASCAALQLGPSLTGWAQYNEPRRCRSTKECRGINYFRNIVYFRGNES